MNKSIIIIVVAVWLLCAAYLTLGKMYSLPHWHYAMVGSWVASFALLACIIIFIRKNKGE